MRWTETNPSLVRVRCFTARAAWRRNGMDRTPARECARTRVSGNVPALEAAPDEVWIAKGHPHAIRPTVLTCEKQEPVAAEQTRSVHGRLRSLCPTRVGITRQSGLDAGIRHRLASAETAPGSTGTAPSGDMAWAIVAAKAPRSNCDSGPSHRRVLEELPLGPAPTGSSRSCWAYQHDSAAPLVSLVDVETCAQN
jgi:hypothetical protein